MITEDSPLTLGSSSPRRRELLETMGIPIEVHAVQIDESIAAEECPDDYVHRIATLKLDAVCKSLSESQTPHVAILVADTSVVVDGRILGKPRDETEALMMVSQLCGKTHRVLTSYGVHIQSSEKRLLRTVSTEVTLRQASEDELVAYVRTGEGLDKAGAYGIQGRAAFLVEGISGVLFERCWSASL